MTEEKKQNNSNAELSEKKEKCPLCEISEETIKRLKESAAKKDKV